MEHLIQAATAFIDRDGYVALFVLMALGNIGIPVGTEIVMPVAGAFVAKGHLSSLWLTGVIGILGELTGSFVLYAIGYYGGRPFVARYGKYVGLSTHKIDVAHAFYERHGSKTVFVCRFIPFLRGVSALPAGISQMNWAHFLLYTAAGSAFFCFGLAALGNALGNRLGSVLPLIHSVGYGVLALAVVAIVVFFIVRSRRAKPAA